MKKNYLFWVAFYVTAFLNAQTIFINEIHYNNVGGDFVEGIEIAGPYSTNLSGYSIVLCNVSDSSVYTTIHLTGTTPNNENYRSTLWFAQAGIQNGSPGGIASDWYYSGINALDLETTNSGATTPFPIGTYHLTFSVVKNQIEGF